MTPRAPLNHHRRTRQTGTSLVEVMVSLLILTVGLLSLAALHASAVRYGKLAEFKTNATQLAEDLADRMRANVVGVRAGDYVYQEGWSADTEREALPGLVNCVPNCDATAAATAVANRDLVDWFNQAIPMLPGVGLFTQQVGGANSSVMDVWVAWQEPDVNADDADNSLYDAYTCPDAMGADDNVRCMRFRFTL